MHGHMNIKQFVCVCVCVCVCVVWEREREVILFTFVRTCSGFEGTYCFHLQVILLRSFRTNICTITVMLQETAGLGYCNPLKRSGYCMYLQVIY